MITSLQNDKIKFVRSLELRKTRKESGLFVAEGVKVVATARDRGWQPVTLIYEHAETHSPILRDLIAWARESGADCLEAAATVMGKLSTRDNPQTIIAIFKQAWLTDVQQTVAPWIALEEIRDPGNLGTIIRTADATGAGGIILIGDCCDPYAREAARASMGSIFNVKLARMDRAAFLKLAAAWRSEIIGTHLSGNLDYRRAYQPGALLIMGSEGPGLSNDLANACTHLVKIPMAGSADSLNLAIATSLMLYEMRRDNFPLPAGEGKFC
jgi:TrmH family RNA methyltransferase